MRPDLAEPDGDIDGGTVNWGHEAQIGYFPQDHTGADREGHDGRRVAAPVRSRRRRKEDIRGLLGQMLFSGEEGLKPTEALSGGEAARLLFCRMMLQKPNMLVLDEPTNHLDLESINALNIALQKLRGHGVAGDARPGPDRRSRHAHLALRARQDRGLQGSVRGIHGSNDGRSGLNVIEGVG